MLYSRNDRTIKKDDSLKILRSVGQNPSLKEYELGLSELKVDLKLEFTLNELYSLAGILWSNENAKDILSRSFKKLDKNKNGFLDKNEFKAAMTQSGERLSEQEFNDFMKLVDQSQDGKISANGNLKQI
jgi:Ca2+-binding EF-hand superfamily protein